MAFRAMGLDEITQWTEEGREECQWPSLGALPRAEVGKIIKGDWEGIACEGGETPEGAGPEAK